MKTKVLLFATLLMSGICFAQHDPTTFTNTNLPNPEPQNRPHTFKIATEDGRCPTECVIYFSDPFIAITLPDIPNQYVNHNTLTCTIKKVVITGTYGCKTARCQSVTYTATTDNSYDAPCKDADGRVWTLVTTQYYHWIHSGRYVFQYYDGGHGMIRH
jgi:hypothetical protein